MAPTQAALAGRLHRAGGFLAALGRAIKVLRTEQGLERKELARLSGLSYPYVSEIEQGKKQPSSESLEAIASSLRLRQSELLERAERQLEREVVTRLPAGAVARRARRLYRLNPAAPSVSRDELKELAARASQLGADDFHRVLDLVRRLTR